NTSAPPPSTEMKPNPFSALNHLTTPCAIRLAPLALAGPCTPQWPSLPFSRERRAGGPRDEKHRPTNPASGTSLPVRRAHGERFTASVVGARPGSARQTRAPTAHSAAVTAKISAYWLLSAACSASVYRSDATRY